MTIILVITLTLGIFMLGFGIGVRSTRQDYEVLIDRTLALVEKVASRDDRKMKAAGGE